jgi:hemoglobin-like flavoprotein
MYKESIQTTNKERKPMNSAQINLVQSTFAAIRPIATVAAELFYTRLFTLDPSLRPMFKGDMTH